MHEYAASYYYRQTSLIQTPVIRALPSTGQLICNCPMHVMLTLQKLWAIQSYVSHSDLDMDKPELRAPPNPKVPGEERFDCIVSYSQNSYSTHMM